MKTLFLDCSMGAAGDMLTAALLELLDDRDGFVRELNALGLTGVEFLPERSEKCSIIGTHMSVKVHGAEETAHCDDHHHEGLHDITALVSGIALPQKVREDVLAVYRLLAEAESAVHGRPVSEIHFHEVGTLDAIADITAVCLLLHRLAFDEIVVSPVHVGSGQVRCAHGILPVPAPATAYLLRNVPIYGGEIRGELCTPTGAALLRHFASRFGILPPMRIAAIGYGMGKKDFPAANCVRALLGETDEAAEEIFELQCNLDDMTGEAIGFAMERLLTVGAADVWTQPIGMKKSRPAVLLSVLCRESERDAVLRAMFAHTATLGIREQKLRRYTLRRHTETLETPLGPVRCKISEGYGTVRKKLEYDDLACIAREHDLPLEAVRHMPENEKNSDN